MKQEDMDENDFKKERWEEIRYRGGRPMKVFHSVTIDSLAKLFNRKSRTVYLWIRQGKFNPSDLGSVIQFYIKLTR